MDNVNLESALSSVVLHDSDEGVAAKVGRAFEYYSADNIQEALSLLMGDEKLLKSSYVQVLAGNCYRRIQDTEKALNCWHKALEISPNEYNAYLNIGNTMYIQGDVPAAIENWTKAFTIQPENPTISLNLAVAYKNKGCRIKSTKLFERYLKYSRANITSEYLSVKETMLRLRSKVDLYFKKLNEFKEAGNLKAVVATYIRLISTYADLPNVYQNLGSIFLFDKNYDKALEFFLIVYKNCECPAQVIWSIANLYEQKKEKPLAYCFYKRCEKFIPRSSTRYKILGQKLQSLFYSAKTKELCDERIALAKAFEAKNLYEDALVEYENAVMLSTEEMPEIEHKLEVLRNYINPEPAVIADLYTKINTFMNNKRFNSCIELCDRIILLSDVNSKEGMYAVRCKTECKRILVTREHIERH